MQLKTEYREDSAGRLSAEKHWYLICHVTFSNEELAVINERGLHGLGFYAPPATVLPASTTSTGAGCMKAFGAVLAPFGILMFLFYGVGLGAQPGYVVGGLLAIIGIALFTVGWIKKREISDRYDTDQQTISVTDLMLKPEFMVYAYSVAQAKEYEEKIRADLAGLAQRIRDNIVIPEQNEYEL